MPKHDDLVRAIRSSKISEDMFEKDGTVLALQWVIGREEVARDRQEDVDLENELNEAELDVLQTKQELEAIRERLTAGLPIIDGIEEEDEHEGEDSFDPFSEDGYPGLSRVAWGSGIVFSLLQPIDDTLPHPKILSEKHRQKPDESTFYTSKQQIFEGMFKVGQGVTEELGEGMATLTQMMKTKSTYVIDKAVGIQVLVDETS
ncbi:hypothetical protein G6011_07257 [Alternaria panax]|uniref:Uncharacterized protein n=1 Tax=Alternaria panax TaxID=48097 RepID=A0AAD4FAQ7_9PLEO|nr:hypothetical protein G6011_07257 [Alternaria panax]